MTDEVAAPGAAQQLPADAGPLPARAARRRRPRPSTSADARRSSARRARPRARVPADDDGARRARGRGQGLTRPELAVLLAYGKMALDDDCSRPVPEIPTWPRARALLPAAHCRRFRDASISTGCDARSSPPRSPTPWSIAAGRPSSGLADGPAPTPPPRPRLRRRARRLWAERAQPADRRAGRPGSRRRAAGLYAEVQALLRRQMWCLRKRDLRMACPNSSPATRARAGGPDSARPCRRWPMLILPRGPAAAEVGCRPIWPGASRASRLCAGRGCVLVATAPRSRSRRGGDLFRHRAFPPRRCAGGRRHRGAGPLRPAGARPRAGQSAAERRLTAAMVGNGHGNGGAGAGAVEEWVKPRQAEVERIRRPIPELAAGRRRCRGCPWRRACWAMSRAVTLPEAAAPGKRRRSVMRRSSA